MSLDRIINICQPMTLIFLKNKSVDLTHWLVRAITSRQRNREMSVVGFPGGSAMRNPLPMQETQVQALIQEEPICWGTTKPTHYNYWTYALEPQTHNKWALTMQVLKPSALGPMPQNKRSHPASSTHTVTRECTPFSATRKKSMRQRRFSSAKHIYILYIYTYILYNI